MPATSTTSAVEQPRTSIEPGKIGPGRWIERWEPENDNFWSRAGKEIARRNLIFSIFAEHIGFSVWLLLSVVVVQLYGSVDSAGVLVANSYGWKLTPAQGLTLLAVASGVGAMLRIPYTFAVPLFGGRNWTIVSALVLLVPCLSLAWVVGQPDVPMWVLIAVAASAGFGGGNFASSMTNITFFYPEREKGWALGLNAAGGNIGVAVAQKLVPLVIALTGSLAAAGLLYAPLAIASATCAYLYMDNLREAKADPAPTLRSLTHWHTWLMSLLYIGTFGSFIGYSAAFPSLLKVVFARGDVALSWGFLGAFVGSLARPYGGKLADRYGGSIITLISFLTMALAGYAAVMMVQEKNLPLFFASFMLLFIATGIGNGSTYRMIPAIFKRLAAREGGELQISLDYKRQAAAAIGFISAVGAVGGFFIPLVYAWSNTHYGSILPALRVYVGLFLGMAALTFWFYLRRRAPMHNV